MNRAGITAWAAVLAMTMIGGCSAGDTAGGSMAPASSVAEPAPIAPTKQLTPGDPCDLISGEEIARIVGTKLNTQSSPKADGRECAYSFIDNAASVTVYRGLPKSTPVRGEPTTIGRFRGAKQEMAELCGLLLPLGSGGGAQVLGASTLLSPSNPQKSCAASEKIVLAMYERLP